MGGRESKRCIRERTRYVELKDQAPGLLGSKRIKWNFTKFLVSKDGTVVKRYAPTTKPEDIAKDIESHLA